MANLMPYMSVLGTGLSVGGAIAQGSNEKRMADFQAAQLEQRAGQTRASAQRAAEEMRRQGRLRTSALQARAGLDAGTAHLAGELAGDAEYRALSALYEGDERAAGDEMQADAVRKAGKQARTAGYIRGASSFLAASNGGLFERYGKGGYDFGRDGYGGRY